MEAEFSDLYDRKMMALYGAMKGKPSMVDFATSLTSKARHRVFKPARHIAESDEIDAQTNEGGGIQNIGSGIEIDQDSEIQREDDKLMIQSIDNN